MLCTQCSRAIPLNMSKHASRKMQSQVLRTVSGTTSRTTVRQIPSARHLTTTTTRSISTQLTRFSSPSSSLLSSAQRTTLLTSATPSFQSSPTSLFSSPSTRSFSATAFLGAKRDTYNPSRRVQKRRHGFLARLKSRGGRKVLMRRRAKGRTNLSW